MSDYIVTSVSSQEPSPNIYKSKIRIGIPPVPRAHGEKVIFTHLPLRVKLELKTRGWKFYIMHVESVVLNHDANGRGAV